MLHEFVVSVPFCEIAQIEEQLYVDGIYNFYYELPINTVKFSNGYTYEKQEDAQVELKIYAEVKNRDDDIKEKYFSWIEKNLKVKREMIEYQIINETNSTPAFEDFDLGNGWIISYPEFNDDYKNQQVIKFDPQGAFGTGLHGTTQDCLRMLLKRDFHHKTILDIGTGSGILTVAAAMKRAREVIAIDIEPVEREIRHQLKLNDITTPVQVIQTDVIHSNDQINGEYDLIIINIGVDESLQIIEKHHLFNKSKAFLISGVVEWYEDHLLQKFLEERFSVVERMQTDEWVTLYFEK